MRYSQVISPSFGLLHLRQPKSRFLTLILPSGLIITRDFDSFKTTKSYKPLKNGYFFVNLLLFILRTLSYFDIMYIQGSDKHAYKKN